MALDLKDYTKTLWVPEMPITQDRMENLEEGVKVNRDALKSLNTDTANINNSLDTMNRAIAARPTQAEVQTIVDLGSGQGTWARTAIVEAMENETYTSLKNRFDTDESKIAEVKAMLGTKNVEGSDKPVDAYSSTNTVYNAVNAVTVSANLVLDEVRNARTDSIKNVAYDSLFLHLRNIDSNLDVMSASIADINSAAGQGNTITSRFAQLDALREEVAAAHRAVADGEDPDTLVKRFTAIENTLTYMVNRENDIVNRIDTPDSVEKKVLDARQGRVLRDLLYKTGDTAFSSTDTVASRIKGVSDRTDTLEDAIGNASLDGFNDLNTMATNLAAVVNEINAAHRILEEGNDNLNLRFEDNESNISKIQEELDHAHTSSIVKLLQIDEETGEASEVDATYAEIDDRFEAIETHKKALADELSAAHVSSVVRTEVQPEEEGGEITYTDTTYDTLNERLEAIETHAAASKENIDIINDNLTAARTSSVIRTEVLPEEEDGEITYTDTTYDTLDERLEAIEGYAVASKNNIDIIAAEINNAHRTDLVDENNESINDSLDKRFDDIEAKISHPAENEDAGGLTERLAAAEGRLDVAETNINTKASTSDVNTLVDRVDALEKSPKSATVVLDNITYNESTGAPTNISDPSTDVDYLLKNGDKYYYWKYIKSGSNPDTFEWALISGASGTGNSSGFDMTESQYTALEEHTENTDYYVSYDDGTVHHYRYVIDTANGGLKQIEIGQFTDFSKIKRYNIGLTEEGEGENAVTYLNLYLYDYPESSNTDTERTYFNRVALPKGGGGSSATGGVRKRLKRIGDQQVQTIVGSTVILLVFYSYWTTIVNDENLVIPEESSAGTYILKNGNTVIETGTISSGAYNDTAEEYKANTEGYIQFDVSKYCKAGDNVFELTVTTNGEPQGKDWTITLVDLRLESDAPLTQLINNTETYNFSYTPFGAISKKLFIKIDDTLVNENGINLPVNTAGRPATYAIPPQSHGVHRVEMYMTGVVGGVTRTTNSIIREYIWYDESNDDLPILLASSLDGQTVTAPQYSTILIPYQVYKKGGEQIAVDYYLNDETNLIGHEILEGANEGTLSYLAVDETASKIIIKVEDKRIVVNLNITVDNNIDIAPVSGAIIDFDPTSLTNNSTNRLPSWTVGTGANVATYSLTASDNFNWSNDANGGGYKDDIDGKCLVIKAGTYIDLNYPLFTGNSNNNILTRGAEFKIIFKTSAVRSADAVWLLSVGQLFEKNIGLQLGVHSGWLKTTKAVEESRTIEPDENGVISMNGTSYNIWKPNTAYNVDDVVVLWDETDDDNHLILFRCIQAWDNTHSTFLNAKGKVQTDYWLSVGKITTNISATDSYLYMPYSELDKVELDINVNQYNATASTNFIMSYEDGVPSKVYAYSASSGGDGLYHSNTIRIGSDDCDVYLYHLRIYNKQLGTADILQNFIADGRDFNEKVERYNRNCIYWDAEQKRYFTSPSGTAHLDPLKLAEVMPDVKILMLDTPIFTTSKKDFVFNSSLRCIHADGGNVYTSRGDADNWLFVNGFHSGQGTTSDNYGQSARNVDFLFEVDGQNWPTKSKNMGTYKPSEHPDYKSTVYIGKEASTFDGVTWTPTREPNAIEICLNWKEDQCKISLTSTSVPNNYFNLKVNVASSENVNNALFLKRYDDFLVYNAPSLTKQIAKHRDAYRALGVNPDNIKIKNSMEFVPAVLFIRENDPVLSKHVEFNDTNWHFYALGNIGDSKKTDYTRAYDPDDMNEFTCENSDNNTNNGQFQSGVFMYNDHEAIETDYTAWSETAEYQSGNIVVYNGMIYTCKTTATIGSWVPAEWTAVNYTGWTSNNTSPYFAPRINPNPMDYIFPITSDQWNVLLNGEYLNRKHKTLIEEEFDGDHSFEFRYACCGDYRDGDLINDTTGKADDQFELNHNVVLAFYEWLITATPEQFVAEAPQWFVKSAMEFFYAYTHYYTMMDNRAKNTFWHFAKTGTYVNVSHPVKALLHVYEESTDNGATWLKATGTEIDTNKQYRTQYAFDLWAYDMDTALGIDNNGELSFPYGKEDDDYRVEGVPTSGYAFNGAGSIFWRRLKTSFASEIAEVMNTAQDGFNAEDLIEEFDQFQNCFPEEVWRLDIERKYIRTFTGESVDNSIRTGKKNPRFLTSMMLGRKKYQRRQWIRNQSLYFNSKYRLKDITVADNTVEFNVITPADKENAALTPNYDLKLTPYQDMYLNVTVGNGGPTPSIRAKAGKTYTIPIADYTAANFGETRIYIYGFKGISGVGNLASMYPYKFTLNALDRLKVLDMGTDVTGYVNANLTALPFTETTELPLLETLNIKNCHSLGGPLSLNKANNLRTLEAAGTTITGVNLPQYTSIETLHLPSSVINLILYGARKLTDFKVYDNNNKVNYSSLFTLYVTDSDYSGDWYGNKEYKAGDCILLNNKYYRCTQEHISVATAIKENTDATEWNAYLSTNWIETKEPTLPVDWIKVASDMISKKSVETDILLLKLHSATIQNIETLDPFNSFRSTLQEHENDIDLSGVIHVTGAYSEIEKEIYELAWTNLDLNVSEGTLTPRYQITYKYDDYVDSNDLLVPGKIIKTIYHPGGTVIPDIYDTGVIELPTRKSTVQYNFQFGELAFLKYIPNSGWRSESSEASDYFTTMPIADSNMVILTHFKTEERKYPVRWLMKRNDPTSVVKTSVSIKYGSGEDLEAPTVTEIHLAGQLTSTVTIANDIATYSIFAGWEKLPINIQPTENDTTYDICAIWDTNSISLGELFADTSNLTPLQLLILSKMNSTQKTNYITNKVDTAQKVSFELGYNSIEPGIDMLDGVKRFDIDVSQKPIKTNILPMKEENNAFTIMIDYSFNSDMVYNSTDNAAILMSCYYQNSTTDVINGFALYQNLNSALGNLGPSVGFGNMFNDSIYSKPVGGLGNSNYEARNVVVLRHPHNSKVLHIYSGLDSSNHIGTAISVQNIEWNNSTSDAYINFGQLTDSEDTEYDNLKSSIKTASCTIYLAKYWNKDLGVGECKLLASWPHETMIFGITNFTNNVTTTGTPKDSNSSPSIGLSTLTISSHGLLTEDTTAEGWGSSTYNSILNSKVMLGLPIKLLAILGKPAIKYLTLTSSTNSYGITTKALSANVSSLRNYLFFPSIANLINCDNYPKEIVNSTYETGIFPWINSGNITIYDYNTTASNSWNIINEADSVHYRNLRFVRKPLNSVLRIFKESSQSFSNSGSTTIIEEIERKVGTINFGDIFIDIAGNAYMFVSNEDIMTYGLLILPATGIFAASSGGWIKSTGFWTRSMMTSDGYTTSTSNHFIYTNLLGVTYLTYSNNTAAPSVGLGLNYSISI